MSLETTFHGKPTVRTVVSVWVEQAHGLIQEGNYETPLRTSTLLHGDPCFRDPAGDSLPARIWSIFHTWDEVASNQAHVLPPSGEYSGCHEKAPSSKAAAGASCFLVPGDFKAP